MTAEKKAENKSKSHVQYRLKDGTRVPGTTTITGVMDKAALVRWANQMGLNGIDTTKYVDELATIGTLTHYMIECRITNQKPELGDYTPNQREAAERSYKKFLDWEKANNLSPECYALSEAALVSEKHRFGGTVDICAMVNGKARLIDIKTCKGIYGEHKTQVAGGYRILCEENGYALDGITILRIGRSELEGFEDITISSAESDLHVKRFLICRDLYNINQQIGR
jgi:hypothetical protein